MQGDCGSVMPAVFLPAGDFLTGEKHWKLSDIFTIIAAGMKGSSEIIVNVKIQWRYS